GLGTITFAPQAMQGLTVGPHGEVPGSVPLQLGLDALELESMNLDLSSLALGQFTSSTLLLQGVTDGRPSFAPRTSTRSGLTPTRFAGHVENFHWGNLTLTGTPAPPFVRATPPTPPPRAARVTP